MKWKLHVYDYKIQLRCISLTSAVVIKKFWHTQEAAWSPYNHAIGCVNITTPIFCHIDFWEFKFYFTLRIGVNIVCMIFFFPSSKFYKIWYKKKLILLNFGYTHVYLSLCVISVQNIFLQWRWPYTALSYINQNRISIIANTLHFPYIKPWNFSLHVSPQDENNNV